MKAILNPDSIAIIGASETPGKVGTTLSRNLIEGGFQGRVYPINPKRETILGVQAYASVSMVSDPIDLAVIATPSKTVAKIAEECGLNGVKALVIISAGFKELGEPGIALEQELLKIAKKYSMRIVGPNCLGVMNPHIHMNATFASGIAPQGSIGFISQSGALCTAVLDRSEEEGLGFSAFVSIGSMLDIDWGDLVEYLANDSKTKSILIYMESIGEPKGFLKAALSALKAKKPLIVMKAGRSEEAAQAAASHTGSLAGSDEVVTSALEQVGAIRAMTINEFFNLGKYASMQPLPKGSQLGIITNAGGPGVLATDAAVEAGAKIAKLSQEKLQELNSALPEHWSRSNPVDVLGDASAELYEKALMILDDAKEIDGLLVILTPQDMTEPTKTAEILAPYAHKKEMPIIASWLGGQSLKQGASILQKAQIPAFPFPDNAAKTFGTISSYVERGKEILKGHAKPHNTQNQGTSVARKIFATAESENRTLLNESEAKDVIDAYGLPVVKTLCAFSALEAETIAQNLGYPVVLKLQSKTITHKSDVGGVKLNLKDKKEVSVAFEEIKSNVSKLKGKEHFEGVTVQKMISFKGTELILGSSFDPQFGPVVLFGAGGTLVEVLKDSSLGIPPLTRYAAEQMVKKTRIYEALCGVRGEKGIDLEALYNLIMNFSQMIASEPKIQECDINPLLASAEGLIALDCRIVCHPHSIGHADLPKAAGP
jgi:acetyltransferase